MSTNEHPVGTTAPRHLEDSDEESLSWGNFQHFLHAPLRRPLMVLLPWGAILLLSVAALFVLPKKYKSSTLILVESEKVPDTFVPKVATEDRISRLENLKPEILSRTRLERVLEETNPYPEISAKTQAVELLRKQISVATAGTDGFTIEFVHRDPHKAQKVADRVSSLFIEETVRSREQQVEGAVDFLATQAIDARKELEDMDASYRRYKEAHMGTLPEQLGTNLTSMQMFQQELQTVEESLIFAREKQESLARAAGRPARGASSAATPLPSNADLEELRRQLALLRGRYTEEHPDVQSLRSRVARLESRLAAIPANGDEPAVDSGILLAQEQRDRAEKEVKRLEEKRADLERRTAIMRAHVEETPRTEQALANLKRDYDKLNETYGKLLSRQLDAQMAGRLERRWRGDRFRMLDPASLPEKPYFPKVTLIIGLGAILGLFVGLGAALVAEYLDPTIKDTEDLQAFLECPVLARIPHLHNLGGSATR